MPGCKACLTSECGGCPWSSSSPVMPCASCVLTRTSRGDNSPPRWACHVKPSPALGILVGIVYLAAASFSGHPLLGLVMFAVMLVFSAAVGLVSRRSETVRGLLDRQDERIAGIDLGATAGALIA